MWLPLASFPGSKKEERYKYEMDTLVRIYNLSFPILSPISSAYILKEGNASH
jgi:hypothetical protein